MLFFLHSHVCCVLRMCARMCMLVYVYVYVCDECVKARTGVFPQQPYFLRWALSQNLKVNISARLAG